MEGQLQHCACQLHQACAWLEPQAGPCQAVLFSVSCLVGVDWKEGCSSEQWFLSLPCRTRKMGSQTPSSSEKGRRKARSTGNASHSALFPYLSVSTSSRHRPIHIFSVAASPPHGHLVQTGWSSYWNLFCTLALIGYLTLSHQPFF